MTQIRIKRRSLLVLIVVALATMSIITVCIWDAKERECLEKEYHDMINRGK